MNYSFAFLPAILSCALVCGCKVPVEEPEEPPVEGSSVAITETLSYPTKTALDADAVHVNWNASDSVAIFYRDADNVAARVWAKPVSISTSAWRSSLGYTLPAKARLDTLYAVYSPCGKGTPFTNDSRLHFKRVQKAVNGGFDSASAPMVSRLVNEGKDKPRFDFLNAFGLLKFSFANSMGNSVDSLVFNFGSNVYGDCDWKMNKSGELSLTAAKPGNAVSLVGPFVENGTYYIPVPPAAIDAKNFRIDMYVGSKIEKSFTASESFTAVRSAVTDLGRYSSSGVEFGTVWKKKYLDEYSKSYVSNQPFTFDGLTVSSKLGPTENSYLKSVIKASFVCASSGKGLLEFKILVYKGNHTFSVDKFSSGVKTNCYTAKSLTDVSLDMLVSVPIEVSPGDSIAISTNGNNDRLYMDDTNFLSWKEYSAPELTMHPTFNSCSFITADGGYGLSLKYRKKGDTAWLDAVDYRGSVTGLEENTEYEIELGTAGGTISDSFKTWASEVPVSETVQIPANLSGTYLINRKGTENGWIRYTCSGGKLMNNSSSVTLYVNDASYVLIDDMEMRGAADSRYVIQVQNSDHVRIRNCDIAGWGTKDYYPDFVNLNGADARAKDGSTLNYEGAIKICPGASCVVVERCFIHDPVCRSCSWYYRHPAGPEAVYMCRPEHSTVLRYNDFVGSDKHRWNDAVEGEGNFADNGGFNRDADINGNFMIFANDDCIEIDGGQCNVRCFDNRFEAAYCGPSVQGCMVGPSYVYNNFISGLQDEFGNSGANIKTDEKNGAGAYCLISDNFIWGRGSLPTVRPGVVFAENNSILTLDESALPAEYPVRPLPFCLGRARVSVGTDRNDLVVPIAGSVPSGTVVVKPDAMDWFTAELNGSSLVVHFIDSKMRDRRQYRGALLVRTPEGLSRPLSIYAESDFVPPLKPDVGSGIAIYKDDFVLKAGKNLTVTFNVPKSGKYWLFIHGANSGSSKQRVKLSVDGDAKGESTQQQYQYGTWSMICPGLTMLVGLNYPMDLTAGEHSFKIEHSRGSYDFDCLALTDTPVAFEPR